MKIIENISELLQKGKAKDVKALVQQAIDAGFNPKEILNEGLLYGMSIGGASTAAEIAKKTVLMRKA